MTLEIARRLGQDGVTWETVVVDEATGGGSQPVLSVTVPLTNAQIKALPGTDIELVAAPGAGKMILPLYALLTSDLAVAYSGIDANTGYPAIWVAHASSPIYLFEFLDQPEAEGSSTLTLFLTSTNEFGRQGFTLTPRQDAQVRGTAPGGVVTAVAVGGPTATYYPDDWDNLPLKIGADNSINFTGGDPANTLTVTVLYTVLDV